MKNLDMLNWDCCPNCDVGGMMQKWLQLQMNQIKIPNTDEIRWSKNIYHTDNIYFIHL